MGLKMHFVGLQRFKTRLKRTVADNALSCGSGISCVHSPASLKRTFKTSHYSLIYDYE